VRLQTGIHADLRVVEESSFGAALIYFTGSKAHNVALQKIENPHVDVLFHPSCRSLGRRPPIDFDFDAVVAAARRTGTALEVDAQADRLDLRDELVRKAVAAGVKIVIDSDAHSANELRFLDDFAIAVALTRRRRACHSSHVRPATAQARHHAGADAPSGAEVADST
jgi:hypothetical protein